MAKINKKTRAELEKYQVTDWIIEEDLNKLSKKEIAQLIDNLHKEDHVYQKTGSYNSPNYKINNAEEKVDGKDYGFNFLFLSEQILSLLKECANSKKSGVEKSIIEIGSGWGATVWKEIYAGCKSTAYDISFKTKYTSANFDNYVSSHLPENLYKNKLTKISGDILKVHYEYPELLGTYDLVNAQNVIHFMGPRTSMKFAQIIYDLLKPGGKAFVSAESYHLWRKEDPSCIKIYNANKESSNKFSGHIKYAGEIFGASKCKKSDAKDIFDQDPYYNISEDYSFRALDHKFDIESLEYIFQEAGFKIQESHYMAFTSAQGVTLRYMEDHPFDKFVGTILEKPELNSEL